MSVSGVSAFRVLAILEAPDSIAAPKANHDQTYAIAASALIRAATAG